MRLIYGCVLYTRNYGTCPPGFINVKLPYLSSYQGYACNIYGTKITQSLDFHISGTPVFNDITPVSVMYSTLYKQMLEFQGNQCQGHAHNIYGTKLPQILGFPITGATPSMILHQSQLCRVHIQTNVGIPKKSIP